jgi:hypothetical protein
MVERETENGRKYKEEWRDSDKMGGRKRKSGERETENGRKKKEGLVNRERESKGRKK